MWDWGRNSRPTGGMPIKPALGPWPATPSAKKLKTYITQSVTRTQTCLARRLLYLGQVEGNEPHRKRIEGERHDDPVQSQHPDRVPRCGRDCRAHGPDPGPWP